MYLRAARSIALHAGVCMNGDIADGYLVKFDSYVCEIIKLHVVAMVDFYCKSCPHCL